MMPQNPHEHQDLVGGWGKTPLKNMSSSIVMMTATQYEWENEIDGNQTTNQGFELIMFYLFGAGTSSKTGFFGVLASCK